MRMNLSYTYRVLTILYLEWIKDRDYELDLRVKVLDLLRIPQKTVCVKNFLKKFGGGVFGAYTALEWAIRGVRLMLT